MSLNRRTSVRMSFLHRVTKKRVEGLVKEDALLRAANAFLHY